MKIFVAILLLLFSKSASACAGCSNCIWRNYDLVANVSLINKSVDYKNAYDAKIDKVISTSWEASLEPDAKPLTRPNVETGDVIKIVESGVIPISSKSFRYNSCMRHYTENSKLFFFGIEVEPGFYESDLCTCTQKIEEDS